MPNNSSAYLDIALAIALSIFQPISVLTPTWKLACVLATEEQHLDWDDEELINWDAESELIETRRELKKIYLGNIPDIDLKESGKSEYYDFTGWKEADAEIVNYFFDLIEEKTET